MTASYSLRIKRSAEKELRGLPRKDLPKIIKKIKTLSKNPRPPGVQKLSGHSQLRVRQGDYRILYTVDDDAAVVEIYKIGHRREVYRE